MDGLKVRLLVDDERRGADESAGRCVGDVAAEGGWAGGRGGLQPSLGVRNTVRHWLERGDWRPWASPSRSRKLDGVVGVAARAVSFATPATPTWFARSWPGRKA